DAQQWRTKRALLEYSRARGTHCAGDKLTQFAQPQNRTRYDDEAQPIGQAEAMGGKGVLQKRNVNNKDLQQKRQSHRAPQPAVAKEAVKSALFVRARVEDVENLEHHQRGESHGLALAQIARTFD